MSKLCIPDPVRMAPGQAFGLAGWAIVAVVISALSRLLLARNPEAPALLRTVVALLPLVPSLLWARTLMRWMGSLDELQRSIQYGAWLAATVGTLFVVTALSLLKSARVLEFGRIQNGLGWEGTFVLLFVLYCAKCAISVRRYQ